MPASNNFILMNPNQANILNDSQLAATNWDESGITTNEVVYSNRMNSILRQITVVTHSLAGLVATYLNPAEGLAVGSYEDVGSNTVTITEARIKSTLQSVILEIAPDKTTLRTANTVWAGPASGAAVAPAFRSLVAADIPSLDANKITTGTFGTAFIADKAISAGKIADAAITVAQIANSAIETTKIKDANVTFAKIQNSVAAGLSVIGRSTNSAGAFAEINAGTDGYVLRRSGTNLGFGQIVAAGIATDAIETAKIKDANITLAKLYGNNSGGILTTDRTTFNDVLISAKHRSVIGYAGPSGTTLGQYYIRKVTQAEYDALVTPDENTIYIIVG